MSLRHVAIIHGPNLNLLGVREPEIYGTTTLIELNSRLQVLGAQLGCQVECFQSNHEGALIDFIHTLRGKCNAIIINAGGLTHTSVSLRDALVAVEIPVYEVHLSNIHGREAFRQVNFIAPIARGSISGLGIQGYEMALRAAAVPAR